MAQVPISQRQVKSQALAAPQASESAPIELFGGGQKMQESFSALGKLAEKTDDVVLKYDKIEVEGAKARAIKAKNAILYGQNGEPGYYNNQGKDALKNAPDYQKKLDEAIAAERGVLSNERQKALFDGAASSIALEFDEGVKKHSFAQAKAYVKSEGESALKAHLDDAALNYKNQGKIGSALANIESLTVQMAQEDGFGPNDETTKARIIEAKTATHAKIIEVMLSNDEDQLAENYFNFNMKNGQISEAMAPKIKEVVEAGALRGASQRESDAILAKYSGVGAALAEARKIENPKLRDAVNDRIKQRFSEKRLVEEEQDRVNYEDLYDYATKHKTLDGVPIERVTRLTATKENALRAYINQLNSGQAKKTDFAYYEDLMLKAARPETRQEFLNTPSVEMARKLSPQDMRKMVDLRVKLAKGDASAEGEAGDYLGRHQYVKVQLKKFGIKGESEGLLQEAINDAVRLRREETGKRVVGKEFEEIVDFQLMKEKGWFAKRVFELGPDEVAEIDAKSLPASVRESLGIKSNVGLQPIKYADVPATEIEKIKQYLSKYGMPTDNQSILKTYIQKLERQNAREE